MVKVLHQAKKDLYFLLVFTLSISLLSGCARVRRNIAYTIYPIGWLIRRIGGSYYASASVQDSASLLQNSTIRSDYASVLSSSRVLFHLGDCEPYIRVYADDIVNTGVQEKDLSVMNAVYDFARYTWTEKNNTVIWEKTDYYEGHAFDTIDHDVRDLYIWLDPVSMLAMAGDIADWMKADNPDAADVFDENYNLLKEDLIELDAEYQQFADELQQEKKRVSFVVVSVSFGCWQKAYGIGVYPLMLSKYGVMPDEEQIRLMEERIRSDQVTWIVHETNLNQREEQLYQRVKNDCGLNEISLSSLSSLSDEEEAAGRDYLSLMYDNLQVLRKFLD